MAPSGVLNNSYFDLLNVCIRLCYNTEYFEQRQGTCHRCLDVWFMCLCFQEAVSNSKLQAKMKTSNFYYKLTCGIIAQ